MRTRSWRPIADILARARYAYGHSDVPEDEPLDFSRHRPRLEASGSVATVAFDGRVHLGVNLRGPDLGDHGRVRHRDGRGEGPPAAGRDPHLQGGSTAVDATELEARATWGRIS